METTDNYELNLVREYVRDTSVNIFLTGKAGTGKTTFLKEVVETSPKRKIVVAPTGVAAINAGGVTVHSFFQMPFGVCLPGYNRVDGGGKSSAVQSKINKTKINIMRSLELLIIDEVSMLRADVLDAMDSTLRKYRRSEKPFGGVQVLMIGDMQQLPPVTKDDEWEILKEYYQTPYFFDSKVLTLSQYICIELKRIYRQSDREFIDLLAKVRDNKLDSASLEKLNSRYRPAFKPPKEEGYIILTTHNASANSVNEREMGKLTTEEYSYEAKVEGDFPDYLYPQDEILVLKMGAQVMFSKNDPEPAKEYVNGTIGTVTDLGDDFIEVTPNTSSGEPTRSPIKVPQAQWENQRYDIDNESKEIVSTIIGMFTQYPLKLAWAITIHKSQGLTFEKAVIDASRSFTHGQVYVALSRCKSFEGMVLSSRIKLHSVISDDQIIAFNKSTESLCPDQERLRLDKQDFFHSQLTDLFDFSQISKQYYFLMKFAADHLSGIYPKQIEEWEKQRQPLKEGIIEVSSKFRKSLDRLVQPDYETSTFLRERISKASEYFLDKLSESIIPLIVSTNTIDIDNKEDKKQFKNIVQALVEALYTKVHTLRYAQKSFELSQYLKIKATAIVEAGSMRTTKVRAASFGEAPNIAEGKPKASAADHSVTASDVEDSELFLRLRNWRYEKSRELNLPAYCIMQQKSLIAICNEKPQTEAALLGIFGIGKKFVEKYGEEVLRMVCGSPTTHY